MSTGNALVGSITGVPSMGPPSVDEAFRRRKLASFLEENQRVVFRGTSAQNAEIRRILGWEPATLERFVSSTMLVNSSTHVSMNAFPPMLAFPWACQRIADSSGASGEAVHLRTELTHNNLSDNRWKPNVWWHYGRDRRLAQVHLFSKQRQFKHQILLAQPIPDVPTGNASDLDRRALALAACATNYAYFCMIYRTALEHAAGMHRLGHFLEVPINLLNEFFLSSEDSGRWRTAMRAKGFSFRAVGDDNELHEVEHPIKGTFTTCHNYLNMGQVYLLGLSVSVGAERMLTYESEMNTVITEFMASAGIDFRTPRFLGIPHLAIDEVFEVSEPLGTDLSDAGIRLSLPVLIGAFGTDISKTLDRLLSDAR